MDSDACRFHEAVVAKQDIMERDRAELWKAIGEMRNDIKAITGKIGWIVGTISVLNSVVMLAIKSWK